MRIGRAVPDFTAHSTQGPIHFHEWKEQSWVALFVHTAGEGPALLQHVSQQAPVFLKYNVKLIVLSSERPPIPAACSVPIIFDKHQELASKLGIPKEKRCSREDRGEASGARGAREASGAPGLYIVGADHKLKLAMKFPASTERNVADEVLNVVDSLRYIEDLTRSQGCLAQLCCCEELELVGEDAGSTSHEHRLRCPYHSNTRTRAEQPNTIISKFYSTKLTHYDKMWI